MNFSGNSRRVERGFRRFGGSCFSKAPTILTLTVSLSLLQACGALAPRSVEAVSVDLPEALGEPCHPPVVPVDGRQRSVEAAYIETGLRLRTCGDRHQAVVKAYEAINGKE